MFDNELLVEGRSNYLNLEKIVPISVILKYNEEKALFVYKKEVNSLYVKKIVKRDFKDLFLGLNKRILSSHNNIILPNGCIFHQRGEKGVENFLMEETPGIRSFRLTNRNNVIQTVQKMYGKFQTETTLLKSKKVSPESQKEIEDQVNLRDQYIASQSLNFSDDVPYKLAFRVFFPYTYILISVSTGGKKAQRGTVALSDMMVMTGIKPVNDFNDILYQFPLPNVSSGGRVCTGKLPIGEFGVVNLKSYVEKMIGFFWNNRFNGDIMTGPNLYGDKNFLGNWFEWEFVSYVNPSKVLDLNLSKFTDDQIAVREFFHEGRHSREDTLSSIKLINQISFLEGFKESDLLDDGGVQLTKDEARKEISNISDSITIGAFDIKVGRILNTGTKKFRIMSYNGFRTFDVAEDSITEKEIWVTHAIIKDQKGRLFNFPLNDRGKEFILDGFCKQQNYEKKAVFPSHTFESGELIGIAALVNDDLSLESINVDQISSIRSIDDSYLISFVEREKDLKFHKEDDPLKLVKMPIFFTFRESVNNGSRNIEDVITQNEEFRFRTSKHLGSGVCPEPFGIKDFFSTEEVGIVNVDKIIYKETKNSHNVTYYNRSIEERFHITYNLSRGDNPDVQTTTILARDGHIQKSNISEDYRLILELDSNISRSGRDYLETVPVLEEDEMIIFGENALMALPIGGAEQLPFRILRDENGHATISSVPHSGYEGEQYEVSNTPLFYPSVGHMNTCIKQNGDTKSFVIKDLMEFDTDKRMIKFSVGDEILLGSDWSSAKEKALISPSIKKIHDFIIIRDERDGPRIHYSTIKDDVLYKEREEGDTKLLNRYKKYSKYALDKDIDSKRGYSSERFKVGTMYAVIDDGSDNLILHPMIDSLGQHFLNGIYHVMKEIGDIEAGDFVQATSPKIPYFAKNVVEKVVGFVDINNRALTVFESGMTMWYDVLIDHFKLMKSSKLKSKRIEFLEGKKRHIKEGFCDVLYGDHLLTQMAIPILQLGQLEDVRNTVDKAIDAFDDLTKEEQANLDEPLSLINTLTEMQNTLNITKEQFTTLIEENPSNIFETYSGAVDVSKIRIHPNISGSSFKMHFNASKTIGSQLARSRHIGSFNTMYSTFDIMYYVYNCSLKNGSARLSIDDSTTKGICGWPSYNSPYSKIKEHVYYKEENLKMCLLTIPTPRLLKKDNRNSQSYLMYKHMGPQNTYYNLIPETGILAKRSIDDPLYATTSNMGLPKD